MKVRGPTNVRLVGGPLKLRARPVAVRARQVDAARTWLFDLDNTLHDASHAAFGPTNQAMTDYIVRHLDFSHDDASALRQRYWSRYGATLLGLELHHGVNAAHFLHHTHLLPDLESRLRMNQRDRAALAQLPGRKVLLTNAPRAYALRVLAALRLTRCFNAVVSIEDMRLFGHRRPKPDARMFRRLAVCLKTPIHRCVLVEDTLAHQRGARDTRVDRTAGFALLPV